MPFFAPYPGPNSMLSWVGTPESPSKPSHSSPFPWEADYGLANLIQVSNSQQSLYFAGDERI